MKTVVAALLAALITAVSASSAWGADPPQTFVVPVCTVDFKAHTLAGWTAFPAPGAGSGAIDTCEGRGQFGILWGGTPTSWSFQAPPDVTVAGLRAWRGGSAAAPAQYEFVAQPEQRVIDSGATLSERNTAVEFVGLNSTFLKFTLACASACPAHPIVTFSGMEMVLRDTQPPRAVGLATGSVLDVGPLSGTVSLKREFVEPGGGLREASLLVDGQTLVTKPICGPPYASAAPCPKSGQVELALDTQQVSNGAHTVRVVLTDVAGNVGVTDEFKAMIANAGAAPATAPGNIVLSRSRVRVAYNKPASLVGSVRDSAGTPIAGAHVQFAIRDAAEGAQFGPAQESVSDAAGRIEVKVPPGPSRVVNLTYGTSTATARIVVPAPVRLTIRPRALRNGHSMVMRGSVAGTKTSTRVELQAAVAGKWSTFRTVKLRNGRFSARYRFTRTYARTVYRFRAVIRDDSHFPYAPGTSRVAKVVVRP